MEQIWLVIARLKAVILAKAGIHINLSTMVKVGPRFRGDDRGMSVVAEIKSELLTGGRKWRRNYPHHLGKEGKEG
jgi:hypothetical protein